MGEEAQAAAAACLHGRVHTCALSGQHAGCMGLRFVKSRFQKEMTCHVQHCHLQGFGCSLNPDRRPPCGKRVASAVWWPASLSRLSDAPAAIGFQSHDPGFQGEDSQNKTQGISGTFPSAKAAHCVRSPT